MRVLSILAPLVTIASGVFASVLRWKQFRRPVPETTGQRRARRFAVTVFVVSVLVIAVALILLAAGNFAISNGPPQ